MAYVDTEERGRGDDTPTKQKKVKRIEIRQQPQYHMKSEKIVKIFGIRTEWRFHLTKKEQITYPLIDSSKSNSTQTDYNTKLIWII